MSFKDWLNDRTGNDNNDEQEFVVNDEMDARYLPISTLLRWYLYDLEVEDREEFAKEYLDIPPISEEGAEMELKDSVERMARVKEYENIAKAVAEINGYIINAIHQEGFEEQLAELYPNMSEEDKEEVRLAREESAAFLDQVGYAACLFMLSVGFNLGLFVPGPSEAIRNFPDE